MALRFAAPALTIRRALIVANVAALALLGVTIAKNSVPDYCRSQQAQPVAQGSTDDAAFYHVPLTAHPTFELDGASYFHPVHWAQTGLALLDAGETEDARTVADELWDHQQDGWFWYEFDWPQTGEKAPWRSAMAQGEALDLFSRLGQLDRAATVYLTLAPDSPVVGGDGWLLEYPGYPPVLNGAMFAAFGLYDYWQASGLPEARDRFAAAVDPIARDVGRFRNPGGPSSYELTGRHRYLNYHQLQTEELWVLGRLAGMPCLAMAADDFARDA